MGRTGRGEFVHRKLLGILGRRQGRHHLRGLAKALGPVVGHGFQPRARLGQGREIVQLRIADRRVQAAFAVAAAVHVPQRQPLVAQGLQPGFVAERYQVGLPQLRQNLPELVLRMPVVALLGQRACPREAAQQQQPRIRRQHRCQSREPHTVAGTSAARRGRASIALRAVASAASSGEMPRNAARAAPMRGSSTGELRAWPPPSPRASAVR